MVEEVSPGRATVEALRMAPDGSMEPGPEETTDLRELIKGVHGAVADLARETRAHSVATDARVGRIEQHLFGGAETIPAMPSGAPIAIRVKAAEAVDVASVARIEKIEQGVEKLLSIKGVTFVAGQGFVSGVQASLWSPAGKKALAGAVVAIAVLLGGGYATKKNTDAADRSSAAAERIEHAAKAATTIVVEHVASTTDAGPR